MAIYLCRWPSGEFSIISARNKADAIVLLDELGDAEQAQVTRMQDCMFDFRLNDDGEIELAEVGEATLGYIMEKCYPVLDQALREAEVNAERGCSESNPDLILGAVMRERARLWRLQPGPKAAGTELGRVIQEQTGAPSELVNRLMRQAADKVLESDAGEDGEPN
jgi:hypothetical protein